MKVISELHRLFSNYKEQSLNGRYIHNKHILPLIDLLRNNLEIEEIGKSVLNKSIFTIKIGHGSNRILIWSQMHGNESTTTKALFDLINILTSENGSYTEKIINCCTLCIIPVLNPDGAEAYTRVNANKVDLNRDAQQLTQPESMLLRKVFDQFKPNFCYNLHGQRTIFSAGKSNFPATVSFLAPAQDKDSSITDSRKKAMEIIAAMNRVLQLEIPGQVGVYDDSFNINCVGDTFQSMNIPTILFEAGHYKNDYNREKTRELIVQAILTSLDYICKNNINGNHYKEYLKIPENQKLFFDIILRDAKYLGKIVDVAIQFDEVLFGEEIHFIPILKKVGDLNNYYGHKEIVLDKKEISIENNSSEEGIEIVVVDKYSEKKPLIIKEF